MGYVRFETLNESSTRVVTNFTGLPTSTGLNWHVHRFPVDLTLDPAPRCLNNYVGGHYDPFAVRSNPNYATDCNPDNRTACEVGDLTGKFGQLNFKTAPLTTLMTLDCWIWVDVVELSDDPVEACRGWQPCEIQLLSLVTACQLADPTTPFKFKLCLADHEE